MNIHRRGLELRHRTDRHPGHSGRRQSDKLFPVHRVYCVGRNYAAHAVEMGHDPNKEPPFFFQKNPDNLDTGGEFPYPPASNDVHHEIEMVVALKSGGKRHPGRQGARLRLSATASAST